MSQFGRGARTNTSISKLDFTRERDDIVPNLYRHLTDSPSGAIAHGVPQHVCQGARSLLAGGIDAREAPPSRRPGRGHRHLEDQNSNEAFAPTAPKTECGKRKTVPKEGLSSRPLSLKGFPTALHQGGMVQTLDDLAIALPR
jgi:hypothetical protein